MQVQLNFSIAQPPLTRSPTSVADMPGYFTGDELGSIKYVSFQEKENRKEWETSIGSLAEGSSSASRVRAIQKLALISNPANNSDKLVKSLNATSCSEC